MIQNKRSDAWTQEQDLLLAETVLRHIREGRTQTSAFEEVGEQLNRTPMAVGFRWNTEVKKNYETSIQLAKKQGKEKKKELKEANTIAKRDSTVKNIESNESDNTIPVNIALEDAVETVTIKEVADIQKAAVTVQATHEGDPKTQTFENITAVIDFLNYLQDEVKMLVLESHQLSKGQQTDSQLQKEVSALREENETLKKRLIEMEEAFNNYKQDTEDLMRILDRTQRMMTVIEDEQENQKFKMDRNGNLEKIG